MVSGLPRSDAGWLAASDMPLVDAFDAALLDLDGTLYRGSTVVPAAPDTVRALRRAGARPAFVTNNASRTPTAVVEHLAGLGLECDVTEVTTSAQAGAALVAARVPPGSPVLVVGGVGVREALREVGLRPVDRADSGAVAILQGWSPDLTWRTLAEGAFALAAGLAWFVTNTDLTLPTDRGIAPGNGSLVALLARVTGRTPDAVAGKPMAPLLEQASAKLSGSRPIVVGDRLDTDIQGAHGVGLPSLLVLSGVTDLTALLVAGPAMRPTFLAADVAGLLRPHRGAVRHGDGSWSCGRWTATVVVGSDPTEATRPATTVAEDVGVDSEGGHGSASPGLVLTCGADPDPGRPGLGPNASPESRSPAGDDGLDAVRAAAAALWTAADAGQVVPISDRLLAALESTRSDGSTGGTPGPGSAQQGP